MWAPRASSCTTAPSRFRLRGGGGGLGHGLGAPAKPHPPGCQVMMPAGGAVPRWKRRHDGVASGAPPLAIVLLKRGTRAFNGRANRHTHSACMAPPGPKAMTCLGAATLSHCARAPTSAAKQVERRIHRKRALHGTCDDFERSQHQTPSPLLFYDFWSCRGKWRGLPRSNGLLPRIKMVGRLSWMPPP